MSRKNNINKFAVPMAAVAATTSIAAPLVATMTSCSTTSEILNYDKEYGVTKKTYENMKSQLQKQYELDLINNKGYSGEALKEKMNELGDTMSTFDRVANSQSKNNRYTSATYSLSHFAKTRYGINLERDRFLTKKITWSSVDQMFQGLKNSCDLYLHNNNVSDAERNHMMQKATDQYHDMRENLQQAYPNDTLSAIMRAQINIVKCFEDVNEQIALVAAQTRLQDFMNTYSINYKNNPEQNGIGKIDATLNASIGKTLSNDLMNQIFEFTDVTTGKTVTFKNDMIPSHVIKPVLTRVNKDKYSNTYSLDCDWQIYKINQDDTEAQIKRKTAHLYLAPNQNKFNKEGVLVSEDETVNDLMEDASVVPTGYQIGATQDYTRTSIMNTYFNSDSEDGYISGFHWSKDTSKPNPWETLFTNKNDKVNNTLIQHLTLSELIRSGLQLDFTRPQSQGGGVITYNIAQLLTDQIGSAASDEDLNLAQKFAKYCDLEADVTIVHDEENNHEASAKFIASYRGDQVRVWLNNYDVSSNNFAISESLYTLTNTRFNKVYESLETYRSAGIKDLKNSATSVIIHNTIALAAQVAMTAAIAVWAFKSAGPVKNSTISKKLGVLLMSSVQLIALLATSISIGVVSDPVFDFSNKLDKMKNEVLKEDSEEGKTFQKILNKLDNDHDKYFVLWDKDKNADADFQTKKKSFTGLPWLSSKEHPTSAKDLMEYYCNFLNTNEWSKIQELADKYHVGAEEFHSVSTKYDNHISATSIISQLGSAALIAVADYFIQRLMKNGKISVQDIVGNSLVDTNKDAHEVAQQIDVELLARAKKDVFNKHDQLLEAYGDFRDMDPGRLLSAPKEMYIEYRDTWEVVQKKTQGELKWLSRLYAEIVERMKSLGIPSI